MSVTTLVGMNVVVTGKVPGYDREGAMLLLRNAGAITQKSVTGTTDVLVMGADVGRRKTDDAAAKGVECITWQDAVALMNGAAAAVRSTTPPVVPSRRSNGAATPATRQVDPMMCKAYKLEEHGDALPSGSDWLYEVKWDGNRCVASSTGGTLVMASREHKLDYVGRFPAVADELRQLADELGDFVLDGEVVVVDEEGRSDIQRLGNGQERYVCFDVLEVGGDDLRGWPLEHRRQELESLYARAQQLGLSRFQASPAFDDGDGLLEVAIDKGYEGIVAKRKSSRYQEGKRAADWLKIKLRGDQEFAVVGYTKGKGNRLGSAGALLLAYYDPQSKEWIYVGDVGTGLKAPFWKTIAEKSKQLVGARAGANVVHDLTRAQLRDVVWVKPEVVVQIRFQRWTDDEKLWHPSVVALRDDKAPTAVRRAS